MIVIEVIGFGFVSIAWVILMIATARFAAPRLDI